MTEIINEPRTERDIIRISAKENIDSNEGKTASYILKALIVEDKEVYIKYVDDKRNSNNTKVIKLLIILRRMLKDPLNVICGGYENVPEKYKGKKLTVVCDLPYLKDSSVSNFQVINNEYKKVQTEESSKLVKKATIIRLRLAYETE